MTTANASYPRITSDGPAWTLRGARNGLVAGVVMAMAPIWTWVQGHAAFGAVGGLLSWSWR